MQFIEKQGDLFSAPSSYVLGHCISADVTATRNMNAGIAKTFRQKYSEMAASIQPFMKTGRGVRYVSPNGRVIYNLVTKRFVYQKAVKGYQQEYYMNLRRSLIEMRENMIQYNEKLLALPKICCRLDQGNWDVVKDILRSVFEATDIEIVIYIFDPIH